MISYLKQLNHYIWDQDTLMADPRLEGWFMMESWMPFAAMIAYLIVIFTLKQIMKNRPALELRGFLIVYNFLQVCCSGYISFEIYRVAYLSKYNLACEPVDRTDDPLSKRMLNILYYYYLTKLVDLVDTIAFALRKKDNQITILHLYHHASIIPASWVGVKYAGGGNTFYLSAFNSLIHTIMYAYYGLAAMGPHMQKYLWWKKYLTQLQLIQFVTTMIHSYVSLRNPSCQFPRVFSLFYIVYGSVLCVLFSNFYFQTYSKKVKSRQQQGKGKLSKTVKKEM